MDFEDTMPLHVPLSSVSEGDDALTDRLTLLFAEYVDMTQLFPQEDY